MSNDTSSKIHVAESHFIKFIVKITYDRSLHQTIFLKLNHPELT
jgi:hypothetical protein